MLHVAGATAVAVLCTLVVSLPLHYRALTKDRAYRMHLPIAAAVTRSTLPSSCSNGTIFALLQRENEYYSSSSIGHRDLQQATANIRVPSKLSRGLLLFHHLFNDTDVPAQYSFGVSTSLELQLTAHNTSVTSLDSDLNAEQLNHWTGSLSGYRLGAALRSFMSKHDAKVFLTVPTIDGALGSVAFRVKSSNNRHDFESFCTAISTYKKIHNGSLVIPRGWAVPPHSPWPEECWHMRLGAKVSATRAGRLYNSTAHIARLNGVGFIWSPAEQMVDRIVRSARAYKSLYGHTDIPRHFTVPISDYFPEDCWGLRLGLKLSNYRYRGDYSHHRDLLVAAGVTADKAGQDDRHWQHVYSALQTYRACYGSVDVPADWKVPSSPPWQEDLWGLKLGCRVNNIKYRGDFIGDNETCRALLSDLGFSFKFNSS